MKKIYLLLLLVLAKTLFASNFEILAKVNDRIITSYDFNIFAKNFSSKKMSNKIILDMLITENLKLEAIAKEKIKYNEEEFKKSGIKNKNDYLWIKFIERIIRPKVIITKSEMDDLLEYNKSIVLKTSYNISQIIIYDSPTAKELIDKLYQEIRQKNHFDSLAEKFSEINKEKAGLIGWVDDRDLNPLIYDEIKNLPIGRTGKPIFLNKTYILIKVNNKKEQKSTKENDFERAQYLLYNQKLSLEVKKYYDDLYNTAVIEIYKQM
jgi:hypothetical protein